MISQCRCAHPRRVVTKVHSKGPFIIYAGGEGGSRQFQDTPRGVRRKLVYKSGGLSDFTILFYFKEMCSLLSAVLNGT